MWHKHLTYCALLKFIVLLVIMEDGSAPKKAKYLRKAGERARPPLPVFKKETCIDQLVPPTTIMAFYKYTAENIYRAEMLCETEQQVGPFVPCCEYLLSTVSSSGCSIRGAGPGTTSPCGAPAPIRTRSGPTRL